MIISCVINGYKSNNKMFNGVYKICIDVKKILIFLKKLLTNLKK